MAKEQKNSPEKILEKSPLSGIAVPIAIVLVGALIIFGVTRMLADGRGYKDLVHDLQSKTFGNRWIAAFELSKYLNGNQIAPEDRPWLIENLKGIYETTIDPRTKNFIVLALGSLKDKAVIPILNDAILSDDKDVKVSALSSMAKYEAHIESFDWAKIKETIQRNDPLITQMGLLLYAQHKKVDGNALLSSYLNNENIFLRYAAATGLINYNNLKAKPVLKAIMGLNENEAGKSLNTAQLENLKLNIINAISKNKASDFLDLLKDFGVKDKNIKVQMKAQEVLNILKN